MVIIPYCREVASSLRGMKPSLETRTCVCMPFFVRLLVIYLHVLCHMYSRVLFSEILSPNGLDHVVVVEPAVTLSLQAECLLKYIPHA